MGNCPDTPYNYLPPKCPPTCNCTTDDIPYKGISDICTGILTDQTLTEVLNRIRTYAQNRLFQIDSESLVITPLPSSCEKRSRIEIVPSEDEDNIFTLGSDGYPYVPYTGGGEPFSCSSIGTVFTTDSAQKNTIDPTIYDFLITGEDGCQKVSPPTSFAVAGNTRVSAFGKMEWYSTLSLANTAANSGETVLIFNDSNEILTVKAGVDYFGVGQHTLQGLSANVSTTNLISNLTFTQNSSVSQGKVICSNVVFSANLTVTGTGEISGFDVTNELSVINVIQQGVASYFTANCIVGITDNGKVHNSTIINNNPDLPPILGLLQITGSPDSMCSVSHTVVKSKSSVGLYAITPAGSISISNMDIETGLETAVYLHSGSTADLSTGRILIASHINARNIGTPNSVSTFGNACVHLVSNAPVTPIGGTGNSSLATHIHAFSSSGAGINVTGFGMKHCYGFSIDGPGISSFNEENQTYRTEIVECVGESRNFHGLHLEKNVYVAGGTFITRSISPTINPICLADDGTDNDNYYIAGVKTIARNTAAYAIRATSAITARISGCQFLNEYLATGVPGIDTTNITLNAVTIDTYGNIT